MVDDVSCNGSIPNMLVCVAAIYDIGPGMLNSTEHEICHAQKGKMSIIIGNLKFMSMINATS